MYFEEQQRPVRRSEFACPVGKDRPPYAAEQIALFEGLVNHYGDAVRGGARLDDVAIRCTGDAKFRVPVKELGLALLSPCGPSLSLGVGFALDAFFQLNRPDGGPLRGGTDGSNPAPSSEESRANRVDLAHDRPARYRLVSVKNFSLTKSPRVAPSWNASRRPWFSRRTPE
jgi:hypothetical protein